jgi:hypothetical protein
MPWNAASVRQPLCHPENPRFPPFFVRRLQMVCCKGSGRVAGLLPLQHLASGARTIATHPGRGEPEQGLRAGAARQTKASVLLARCPQQSPQLALVATDVPRSAGGRRHDLGEAIRGRHSKLLGAACGRCVGVCAPRCDRREPATLLRGNCIAGFGAVRGCCSVRCAERRLRACATIAPPQGGVSFRRTDDGKGSDEALEGKEEAQAGEAGRRGGRRQRRRAEEVAVFLSPRSGGGDIPVPPARGFLLGGRPRRNLPDGLPGRRWASAGRVQLQKSAWCRNDSDPLSSGACTIAAWWLATSVAVSLLPSLCSTVSTT